MSLGVTLKEGERLLHVERTALVMHTPILAIGCLLTVLPFFFFFPLAAFGTLGLSLLIVVSGIGVLLIAKTALHWRGTMCAVTNRRLIYTRQVGLFERSVQEASLKTIRDLAYRKKGFLQSVIGVGAVRVTFLGVVPNMHIERIRRPRQLQAIIESARHELGAAPPTMPFRRVKLSEVKPDTPTS